MKWLLVFGNGSSQSKLDHNTGSLEEDLWLAEVYLEEGGTGSCRMGRLRAVILDLVWHAGHRWWCT